MKNIELRFIDFKLENATDENLTVSGYVNEVGKLSHLLSSKSKSFRERIMPGAFSKALSFNDDVHFLAEHDTNKILASTRNNSLELKEDEKGLFMRANICKTSYGKDYHTLIKDGILRNMSFGFNVLKDRWTKLADGTYTRDITDLVLYEVSVVTNPAYPQSSILARGLNLVEDVNIPETIENEVVEEDTLVDKNTQEKEEIKESEKIEQTEETKEAEDIEANEKTKEEQPLDDKAVEKRAYVGYICNNHDVMNYCLEISANCLSLATYFQETSTNVEMIPQLKELAQKFATLMIGQIETPFDEVVKSEEQVQEETNQVEEKRNQDLSKFYAMLDEVKRKDNE